MATPSMHVFSVNVRGIRSKKKRLQFFRLFKKLNYDIICIQESHITKEVAEQWRKEWAGELVYTEGTGHSAGQLILIRKGFDCIVNLEHSSERILVVDVEINNHHVAIMNIYGPQPNIEKIHFLEQVSVALNKLQTPDILICGDFNVVLNNDLDIISGEKHPDHIVKKFKALTEDCDLYDTWRLFHPDVKEFTWSRSSPFVARRLDYILSSSSIYDRVFECFIVSLSGTDHRGCSTRIRLCDTDSERGPGTWHFNGSLLKDTEYVREMNQLILLFNNDHSYSEYDYQMRWELLKLQIKNFTVDYCKRKSVQTRHNMTNMYNNLNDLDNALGRNPSCPVTLAKRDAVKLKIEVAEQHLARAAQIRAKVQWVEKGEKNNKYFLGLEKARANARIMDCLIDKNGKAVTDQRKILNMQKEYFNDLYTKKIDSNNLNEKIDTFLRGSQLPTLTEEQKHECEGLLTEDEVLEALKSMKNGSSPGCDGLSTEFLKFFWNNIRNIIVPSFNNAFTKGFMSKSQQKATIILIHKGKNLTRNDLNNWRPISLTNSDYKLLAKCLARRLSGVIDSLVHVDQVGYIKGRKVSSLLRLVDDVIDMLNRSNKPGLLVTIDFFHAYDCLSKDLILATFEKFGFGETFIKWVNVLMYDTKSCIGYNGCKSDYFEVNSGLRQGCPFSPLAFVLTLELLAIKIRHCENIQGIHISNDLQKLKIALYADDITLFLLNCQDMCYAMNILNSFSLISGLRINRRKSELMWLGNQKNSQRVLHNFSVKKKIKILGIYYCNDKSASQVTENWSERIGNIKRLIKQWERRNLSIIGKIQVIKTFLVSQLVYAMQVIIIPDAVLIEVNRLLFRFVWRKSNSNRKAFEKVKRVVMCHDFEHGGLKMLDVRQMQASFVLHWVVRLCRAGPDERWSFIPHSHFSSLGVQACFYANVDSRGFKGLDEVNSYFWKEVLMTWLNYNKAPLGIQNGCTLLWNNKNITCQGKVLFFKDWIKAGLIFVKDVYNDNEIVTYDWICQKVGHGPDRILQYYTIRMAMFNFLRKFAGNINEDSLLDYPPFCGKQMSRVCELRSKLVTLKYSEPCCKQFWRRKFNYTVDKKTWLCSFNSTQEIRLRLLQWKIVHNIYPTNIMLAKMHVKPNNKCSFCPDVVDVIEHFFFECPKINNFWKCVEKFILHNTDVNLKINVQTVLFGINQISSPLHLKWINHIILLGKMCVSIYKKRNAPYPIEIIFYEHLHVRKLNEFK